MNADAMWSARNPARVFSCPLRATAGRVRARLELQGENRAAAGAVLWAAASPDILPPVSAHTDLHHVRRAFADEAELRRALTRPGRRGARERSVLRVFARLHVRPRPKEEALYRILLPGVLGLKGPS